MGIKIKTKPFGEVEVEEKQIVDFPDGILGFEDTKRYVILDASENSPLKWMQSYSDPELAFVIMRPVDFMGEYELSISQADLELVQAERPDDLLVFAIITIPANPSEMTANLQGPIIINPRKRIGRQAISLSEKYSIRHRVVDEIERSARKG